MNWLNPTKQIFTCPHCDEETHVVPALWHHEFGTEYIDRPHENPFECIKYLKSLIDATNNKFASLKENL